MTKLIMFMKDKNVAAFLAIVFGVVGLQKLYLGNWVEWGFCLALGIASLGSATFVFGIYDGLNLIKTDWNLFNNRYNRKYSNVYKPR